MKKLLASTVLAVGLMGFAGAASAEECGRVTIANMNWASAEVLANIDQIILSEGYGCDAELVAGCHTALEPLLGITRAPVTWRVDRHREGIPQYELGHATRLRAIDERLRGHPGLRLTGNSYRGISVPDVVADAERVAIALAGSLTA